jgi:ribosome-associated toxin RatA of RatAB toxin-antitoxin module
VRRVLARFAAQTALAALLVAAPARAADRPLSFLPAEKLQAMGPLLRTGEIALIESAKGGRMRQVTVMALVAAPPELTHEVVVSPEKYPEFIRNLTRSKVQRNPDGTIDDEFWIDLTLTHFEGTNRYRPNRDGSVDVKAIDPNDDGIFRWEFYRVPGGTVMVMYGYQDVLHSNDYIRRITDAVPSMEHGLALAAQLAYVRSIKARAEALAKPGSFTPFDAHAKGPGFDFLLQRGRVAVIRSLPDGHLADISILDRLFAPLEKVLAILNAPASYASFIEGVKKSRELQRSDAEVEYQLVSDLSIFSWDSRFAIRPSGRGAVDVYGVGGDLRGAQYRWDLTPLGPKSTLAVYRARQNVASSSPLLLGILFRKEPLFEHGLNVALGLVQVLGVRGRAEGWR